MVKATDQTTEEKILSAAKKVFLSKGMDGARMQDIADEAGINKALLHYYFRSKDKLFEQIFSEVSSTFLPRIFTILESDTTLFQKIELFCSEYIEQEIKTPYVPIFIITEINRQPEEFLRKILGNNKPPLDKVLMQIHQETEAGIIRPINPMQLLLNIISLCIFPFLASPMVQLISGMKPKDFNALMEQRKTEVPKLIIESIKNR